MKVWPPMVMLAVRGGGIGIGGNSEIDRRRPGSARRYTGDPRRHAAARPATRRRRVDIERARAARRRRVMAGRIQRETARGRGLRDHEGLTADGDVGTARRGVGIGGDGEIDRRRPGSARRYAGDPRRHAAARPATRRCRVHVERSSSRPTPTRYGWSDSTSNCTRPAACETVKV